MKSAKKLGRNAVFKPKLTHLFFSFLVILVLGCGSKGSDGGESTASGSGSGGGSSAPDTTAPTFSSGTPANAASGVSLNPSVSVTFNEAMSATSVNSAFTVRQTNCSGTVVSTGTPTASVGNTVFTYALTGLTGSATYASCIGTGATDSAGNALASAVTLTWTTVAPGTLATPTANPVAGSYASTQNVVLSSDAGSTICYRTDGTNPAASTPGTCDALNTTIATGATVSVAATTTIKALATQATFTNSGMLTAAFVIDPTSPTVGGGGTITFASIGATGLTVNWTAGTDNTTSPANLQYKVVKDNTATSNIDTIAEVDAKSGGDLLQDYTANIATKVVTGLTTGTLYHFAVVVRDEAGNKAIYTPASQGTTSGISAGDIVISEIMWMGSYDNAGTTSETNDEFIELQNKTGSAISISGWTISGTGVNTITIPASQTIAANGYYVIARDTTKAFALGDYNKGTTLGLSNTNFQLILRDTGSVTIDTANVSTPLAGLNDTTNKIKKSMERRPTGSNGTLAASWYSCSTVGTKVTAGYSTKTIATPGEANSSPVFSLTSASPSSATQLLVYFNEVPTAGTGGTGSENTTNYSIPGLTVSGAALAGSTVTLTVTAQTASTAYTLTVSNVTAASGGATLTGNTANFTGFELPKVKSVVPVSNTIVDVNFQKNMDATSIDTITGSFVFNNGLSTSAVVLQTAAPNANKRVRITTGTQTAGTSYTLTVNNAVQDTAGYGVDAAANTGNFYGFSPNFGVMEQTTAGIEGANATYWTNSGGTLNNNGVNFKEGSSSLTWATLTSDTTCSAGRTAKSITYYPVTPGGSYTGSIFMRAGTVTGAGNIRGRLRIFWFQNNTGTASATPNSLDSGATAFTATSADWLTQHTKTFTAPADAYYMQFQIHGCYSAPAVAADQLYFDQAYFGP